MKLARVFGRRPIQLQHEKATIGSKHSFARLLWKKPISHGIHEGMAWQVGNGLCSTNKHNEED
jgi:hypothetical protein